jgi:hypothetical protein
MLFELHSQLRAATRPLAEARGAMAASNVSHAQLRDKAEASGAPVDALRQRATRAAAAQAALGGEVTRLTAEPAIDREHAVRGFKRVVERFGPPAAAGEKLAKADARRRSTLAYALGLVEGDPALHALAALSEEHVGLLFHLGFSEYHFLSTLCGEGNRFAYRLTVGQVLAWADAHHTRTGKWPTVASGPVAEAPGERWTAIDPEPTWHAGWQASTGVAKVTGRSNHRHRATWWAATRRLTPVFREGCGKVFNGP